MNLNSILVLGLVVAGMAGVTSGGSRAWANMPPKRNVCDEFKGGEGHEVPSPFSNTNQVVELADGEAYTLIGRVVFMGNVPYLNVDLAIHPWLATTRRRAFPYYRLVGNPSLFKDFEQKEVKILAQARLELASGEPNHYSLPGYTLVLVPSPIIPIQILNGNSEL